MSVLNQDLRILHWNCNGFDSAKKSDIFSFLSENSIDILSLNENHKSRPNISSFRKLYHQQSKDLIVCIRQNISFRIIHKSTSSEFDFNVIAIDQSAFIFCYLRHGNVISCMAEGAKKKLEDAYTITFLGIWFPGELDQILWWGIL